MKNILFLSVAFLIISFNVNGQSGVQMKRTTYKLKLAVDNTSFYEQEVIASPFVLPDKTVQLYPGEKVFIEVEQINGVIKNLKAVDSIKDSSKTLIIRFYQTAKGKIQEVMMLEVKNPFPYKLIYLSKIYLLLEKKWVDSNVLPIEAGISGFETWPDIITSIALSGWSLSSK